MRTLVAATAVFIMTVAGGRQLGGTGPSVSARAGPEQPLPPGANDLYAHDVLHFRDDVPFIGYQSLAANDDTAFVVTDKASVIAGPDDPSMIGAVGVIDGPVAALGDLLMETEADRVLVHRRVSEVDVVTVGEFSLTTTQCGDPMQPRYLGTYGSKATYEFIGIDCPDALGEREGVLANVDLSDPTRPMLATTVYGTGLWPWGYTPWAIVMHDGIVARAMVSRGGLGRIIRYTGVELYDARSSPPNLAGTWDLDEPFAASHVMIAADHLYVGGVQYPSARYYAVDISNLQAPRLVSSLAEQPWFTDESDGFGYGSSGEGLVMLDLSDPAAPRVADTVDLIGRTVALLADGAWVHAITRTDGRLWYQSVQRVEGRWGVPEEPVALPGPAGWTGPPDVSGARIAFPVGIEGLHLFGGESSPRYERTLAVATNHVALEGSLAAIARGNEVVVVDLDADDGNEQELRRLTIDSVLDVDTDAGLMAAVSANEMLTLDLDDVTDGAAGRLPLLGARAIALTAPIVVVLESGADEQLELRIVDASEPSLPRVASVVGVPGDTHGIAASGSQVYVVGSTVRTLDLSMPTRPEWVSETDSSVGTILPRQVTAEHGYLFLTLADGKPMAVMDMSRSPPAVVQRINFTADVQSDDDTLVAVSSSRPPRAYDIHPRPIARLALEARCGTTMNDTVNIAGITEPDAITVTLRSGTHVVDTSLSAAGAFTLTGTFAAGVTELNVQGKSDRGPGETTALTLSVMPELPLDPWETYARSGRQLSRPIDDSGCASFEPPWSLVIPPRPFTLDTEARSGVQVTVTVGAETTVMSEVAPGRYSAELTVPDVPQGGMLVRFDVAEGGSRYTIEGAALTFRAYVPRVDNGWGSHDER